MDIIIHQIREELRANINESVKLNSKNFFKDKIKVYGVKTAIVGKIAKNYWWKVKKWNKKEVFCLCESLFESGYMEESFIVSYWLPDYINNLLPSDITTFRRWILFYVDNWAKCDSFCNHTVGDLIVKYPEIVVEMKNWARSENRWLKRASAVSFIVPAKKGKFLADAFEISDMLLTDLDDLVQKGYGWLLKEESRVHQKAVFDYVIARRKVMPRTALRYAIELMPKELKDEAMRKN